MHIMVLAILAVTVEISTSNECPSGAFLICKIWPLAQIRNRPDGRCEVMSTHPNAHARTISDRHFLVFSEPHLAALSAQFV